MIFFVILVDDPMKRLTHIVAPRGLKHDGKCFLEIYEALSELLKTNMSFSKSADDIKLMMDEYIAKHSEVIETLAYINLYGVTISLAML